MAEEPDALERLLRWMRIAVGIHTVVVLLELAGAGVAGIGLLTDRYSGWDALGATVIAVIFGLHGGAGLPVTGAFIWLGRQLRRGLPMGRLPLATGLACGLGSALSALTLLGTLVYGEATDAESLLFGTGSAVVSVPALACTFGFIRLWVMRRRIARAAVAWTFGLRPTPYTPNGET